MKTLQLSKPHILIMIGATYSGKTAFANRFSETFQAPFVEARRFDLSGNEVSTTLEIVNMVLRQLFKTQQTIIYEGITGSRVERTAVAKLAKSQGYEPILVWVQTDINIARDRATKKTKQNPYPLSHEEFERELKQFTPPNSSESYVVISGMHTYASQAKAVLKRLSASKERPLDTKPAREKPDSSRSRSASRPIRVQ